MDDYLSKPIDFAALAQMLARYLNKSGAPVAAEKPVSINESALRQRYASMPEMISALLDRAARQLATYSSGLASSLAKSDFQTAAVIAHALRGSAGALEAATLVSLTRELESAAQAKDVTALGAHVQSIQKEIDACRAQIPAASGIFA